jgi:hypothetical protein
VNHFSKVYCFSNSTFLKAEDNASKRKKTFCSLSKIYVQVSLPDAI